MRRSLAAAALVLALVAGAGVAVARPDRAPAGPVIEQLTVQGHPVTVVVAPGRPGRNLVEAVSAHGVPVTGGGVRSLPAGRSTIHLAVDGQPFTVAVDLDGRRSAAADEECASRLLAAHLAGRATGGCTPPAAGDAARVAAALVRHAGETGIAAVAVRGDDTPRGRAAVRGALAAAGRVRVRADDAPPGPDEALLLVGGWDQARSLVRSAPGRGILLAPWLLEPGVLAAAATQVTVATERAPTSAPARRYLAALAAAAPGVAPTGSGLAAFASGSRSLQLWTPATVSFLPRALGAGHDHAHPSPWTPVGDLLLVRAELSLG